MYEAGRIKAAAEPNAQWHVRLQMFPHGLFQQSVQLSFGFLWRAGCRRAPRQMPVTTDLDCAAAPLKPLAWKQFLDSLDESPGSGHIVQGQ